MDVESLVTRYGFQFEKIVTAALRGEHLVRPPLNQNECIRDVETYAERLSGEARRRLDQAISSIAMKPGEPLVRRAAWTLCGRLRILSSLPILRQAFARATAEHDFASRGVLQMALADLGDVDRISRALEEIHRNSQNSLEGFLVLLRYAPAEFRRTLRTVPKPARRGVFSSLRFLRGLQEPAPPKAPPATNPTDPP